MMSAMRFGVFLLAIGASSSARANPQLAPIVDRNYAIDLYDGVPLGNSAATATGGATAAYAVGSSGTLVNPSAPAVRPTTDTDPWSWDYHLDYLFGSLSSDYANSGIDYASMGFLTPTTSAQTLTAGLALRVHNWGGAINGTVRRTQIVDAVAMLPGGGTSDLLAETLRIKGALAKWVPEIDMAFGLDVQSAIFEVTPDCSGTGCQTLFSINGGGAEVGATWIPHLESFRIGGAFSSAIAGTTVSVANCDPASCDGFILPSGVVAPEHVTIGGAYRFAATPWNQLVHTPFRDEPSVTTLLDVVVTGPSANAYGLDAFGIHELERSGQHYAVSVRGGAEYEWVPGRLRVRGGSYWEPARFEGVSGRLHGTFGIEVRALEFQLWGLRRGRITLTGDIAAGYRNLGLSIGFWH